jgi:hypothetical protein
MGGSRRLPAAALILVLLASAAGLLCTRIGSYDDGILLMGARMVRAGRLPYVDFYAHYGPLGFSLQALLWSLVGNPPVSLRIGQALLLALLGAGALLAARRHGAGAAGAWAAAAFALALSPAALLASFYGTALALAALGAFAGSLSAGPRADLWAAAAGAALAAAALTRPIFAVYAAAAMAGVALAAGSSEDRRRRLPILALAAAVAAAAAWLLLYRRIAPALALDATVFFPRRLLAHGARYREAAFLTAAPLPLAFLFTTLLAAIPLLWLAPLRSRRSRALAAAGILASGALPLWLRVSAHPERDGGLVAGGVFAVALALIAAERQTLRANGALRAAALFGLAAAASEHYLWARADRPHFLPFLVAGAAGAALASVELRAAGRAVLLLFFLFLYGVFLRSPENVLLPAESLWRGGLAAAVQRWRSPHAGWKAIWPCGEVPADAAAAAAFADRHADPGSRFVAVGSDQAFADQNPILLFLLSARLPYTRWYQYDPGVQDSPPVQRQMIEELERSGSRTAVVWFTEVYRQGEPHGAAAAGRTPFDEAFDRLYPVRGPRLGLYEIRLRAEPPAASP